MSIWDSWPGRDPGGDEQDQGGVRGEAGLQGGTGWQIGSTSRASCDLSESDPSESPRAEGAPCCTDEETEAQTFSGPGCSRLFSGSPGDLCRLLNNTLNIFFQEGFPACGRHQGVTSEDAERDTGRRTKDPGPELPQVSSLPPLLLLNWKSSRVGRAFTPAHHFAK